MDTPVQTCPRCNGFGMVAIPVILANVFNCLGSTGKTTPELVAELDLLYRDDCTIPCLCNRLVKLEALGLAVKEKSRAPTGGCWYLWKRA